MFGLGKAARARRVAAETIGPLVNVSRQRIGAIPDDAWRDPYLIGFVGMLITLVAKVATEGRIGDDGLALAQLEAWSDITGEQDGLVGQEICLLSLGNNAEFSRGCSNARRFMHVFQGAENSYGPDETDEFGFADQSEAEDILAAEGSALLPEHAHAFGQGGLLAAALWERYFDQHIS